jgi:hypothetical protein
MTARELREALYYIENQKMTVEQLRKALFEVEKQDEPLNVGLSFGVLVTKLEKGDQ